MSLVYLNNLDDPRLAVYRQLKQSNLTRWSGLFVAEGDKVVERLLTSGQPIESVLLGSQHVERFAKLAPADMTVLAIDEPRVAELVEFNFHRGVLVYELMHGAKCQSD